MAITALAPWFGSNRMLGPRVGEQFEGCAWVGVPFAGGMAELPYIAARTVVANDLHRHVINLARVSRDEALMGQLVGRLRRVLFHPDELKESQGVCKAAQPGDVPDPDLAYHYFVCCWMGRSSKAGIDDEFNGRPAVRWKADGGDSMVRFRSAIRGLIAFRQTARRCTFETMDAFAFLARCEDLKGHGLYCDPPFPGPGERYLFNCGKTEDEQRRWHGRLAEAVGRFRSARVVMRFYAHPLVRELYPEGRWAWHVLDGRTQANNKAAEVLLVNQLVDSLPMSTDL